VVGIWLPGVEVIAGIDGGQFTGAPWRGVLHTTEGGTAGGAISTFQANNFWPHFTIDWKASRVVQHLSLDVAARALQVGSVGTNRANCIQIEMVGFATDTPNWTAPQLEFMASLMRRIEALVPIPRVSGLTFLSFPQSSGSANGIRLGDNDWLAFTGWCGHEHVPGNTHGDPGAIDIVKLLSPRVLGVGSSASAPGPAAAARTPYSLDVLFPRTDRPYAEAWTGQWDGLGTPLGDGSITPSTIPVVATVARKPDVLDAFWIADDGAIVTTFWTQIGGWSPNQVSIVSAATSADPSGGLAALARLPGIIDVFFIGSDARLWTTWWTEPGGWVGSPIQLGAGLPALDPHGGVSAVSRASDTIDVFVVGQDGHVYTLWWTESGGWATSGLDITNAVVAANPSSRTASVARQPDALDVAFIGTDGIPYAAAWDPSTGWAPPHAIGGVGVPQASLMAGPAIVARRRDVLDVFWVSQDSRLHTAWWTASAGWSPVSIQIGDPSIALSQQATPAAVARQPGILDVFVSDANGTVQATWWQEGPGWASGYIQLDL